MPSVLLKETKKETVEKLTIYDVSLTTGWKIKSIMSFKISSHRVKLTLPYVLALQRKKKKKKIYYSCLHLFLASYLQDNKQNCTTTQAGV